MLQLRSATSVDIAFVMATERLPGYLPILGRWEEAKHRTVMSNLASVYFIGECAGEPEGFAIIEHLDDPMGNVLLRRIAMANRGRGLGREMMQLVAAAVFARPEPTAYGSTSPLITSAPVCFISVSASSRRGSCVKPTSTISASASRHI